MKKYIIAEGSSHYYLMSEVNSFLDKGYEPIGGICKVCNNHGVTVYWQALILSDK